MARSGGVAEPISSGDVSGALRSSSGLKTDSAPQKLQRAPAVTKRGKPATIPSWRSEM